MATPSLHSLLRGGRAHVRYLWIGGVVLYLLAAWWIGWETLADAIIGADWRYVGLLALTETAALLLRVLKWRVVLGPSSGAGAACMISKAGGNFSPGRIGELAPLLFKQHRSMKVGAWVLADRLLEICATLGMGLAAVFVIGFDVAGALPFWIGGVLLCGAAVAWLAARHDVLEAFAMKLPARWRPVILIETIRGVGAEFRSFGKTAPLLTLLTVLGKALDIATGWALFMVFAVPVAASHLMAAQAVHALTTIVPLTPNATGIPYAVTAVYLHEAAQVPWEVYAASVPIRFAESTLVFWAVFVYFVGFRWPTEKE